MSKITKNTIMNVATQANVVLTKDKIPMLFYDRRHQQLHRLGIQEGL